MLPLSANLHGGHASAWVGAKRFYSKSFQISQILALPIKSESPFELYVFRSADAWKPNTTHIILVALIMAVLYGAEMIRSEIARTRAQQRA